MCLTFSGNVDSLKHDGRAFFERQYGTVDGNEVQKTAALRWNDVTSEQGHAIARMLMCQVLAASRMEPVTLESVLDELQDHADALSPWPYMVLGLPVPDSIRAYQVVIVNRSPCYAISARCMYRRIASSVHMPPHTHAHTHTHAQSHTQLNTYMHTDRHTHIHAYIHR